MIGFTVCALLMGPSELLGGLVEDGSKWSIKVAFPLLGLMQYFVFVPLIPEMLERVQVDLNLVEGQDTHQLSVLNDKVNDAYGMAYALSQFVGPLIGGTLCDTFGPKETGDYIAGFNVVFALILFVFNCGPRVFSEDRIF